METGKKLFIKHWTKKVGSLPDDITLNHMQYAIDAIDEALSSTKQDMKEIDDELKTIVFEALGDASMCWIPKPSNKVFDSSEALKIGDNLIKKIKDLPKITESISDEEWNKLYCVINGGSNGYWYPHVLQKIKEWYTSLFDEEKKDTNYLQKWSGFTIDVFEDATLKEGKAKLFLTSNDLEQYKNRLTNNK